jgi:hypothetical protein
VTPIGYLRLHKECGDNCEFKREWLERRTS